MTIGAREALDRLRAALVAGELDPDLEQVNVDLMSAFGSAAHEQSEATAEPADRDIGVRFDGPVRLLEVVNLLVDVTGYDGIEVAVVTGEHTLGEPIRSKRATHEPHQPPTYRNLWPQSRKKHRSHTNPRFKRSVQGSTQDERGNIDSDASMKPPKS